MSKYSKTKHNIVKNIIKALEEKGMSEAVAVVREVYPKGEANKKANPESRTQMRKLYYKEVIAPQLKREHLDGFIEEKRVEKITREKIMNYLDGIFKIFND